ncbi:hypothetical protein LCGC14_0313240 [marine sediment metagenome]|uniref:J domain-containing protein n=1 Tax=marine sediment metagenome TaxID=412755 RepID=A0A0F9U420_9ZZZZ
MNPDGPKIRIEWEFEFEGDVLDPNAWRVDPILTAEMIRRLRVEWGWYGERPASRPAPTVLHLSHRAQRAFKVLGITTATASPTEIRTAYREAARRHHPDLGGTEKKMQEVNAAFDALSLEGLA